MVQTETLPWDPPQVEPERSATQRVKTPPPHAFLWVPLDNQENVTPTVAPKASLKSPRNVKESPKKPLPDVSQPQMMLKEREVKRPLEEHLKSTQGLGILSICQDFLSSDILEFLDLSTVESL